MRADYGSGVWLSFDIKIRAVIVTWCHICILIIFVYVTTTFTFIMSDESPQDPFFDDVVLPVTIQPIVNSLRVSLGDDVEDAQPSPNVAKELDKPQDSKCHWTSGETIASVMSFEAARRQKATSTKVYRAEFAASCYPKFAKQLKTEGRFDETIDVEKSRDLRFKFVKTGKNAGESAAYRKVADVKREVMNVILPIYEKQIPQGVPASGIQWEEVMENTTI